MHECCNVDVSAMGRSLVRRSPTERGVSRVRARNLKSEEAYAHKGRRVMEEEKKKLLVKAWKGTVLSQPLRGNTARRNYCITEGTVGPA